MKTKYNNLIKHKKMIIKIKEIELKLSYWKIIVIIAFVVLILKVNPEEIPSYILKIKQLLNL